MQDWRGAKRLKGVDNEGIEFQNGRDDDSHRNACL